LNIVYMHTHDTGTYIEPYGYAVSTPNLLQLAKEAVLFRKAFSAAPTCSPSRVALMTGRTPHSAGMLGLAHRGFRMKDPSMHMAAFLRSSGYETVLCGVQHEEPDLEALGYAVNLNETPPPSSDFVETDRFRAEQAGAYIENAAGRDKPFFLSVGLINTHRRKRDFPVGEPVDARYVRPPYPVPDNEQTREDMAAYVSSVRVVDDCVGTVLAALKRSGRDQDTLFVFTTDHGIPFPGMKCTLYDTGIGVSLILKLPGNNDAPQGVVIDAMVSQLDFFPTVCELTGLPKPAGLQGISMLPLIQGTQPSIRDELFAEVTYHAAYEPLRCIRTERYKLIRLYAQAEPVLSNVDDSASKDALLAGEFAAAIRDREQLYDLLIDPAERANRAEDPRYAAVRAQLSDRLQQWMRETEDPLLQGGKVEKPAGAIANASHCVSPEEEVFE
jgi:N-sulfoglucosamine sulfohydrolase